jgi:hypothetical protein
MSHRCEPVQRNDVPWILGDHALVEPRRFRRKTHALQRGCEAPQQPRVGRRKLQRKLELRNRGRNITVGLEDIGKQEPVLGNERRQGRCIGCGRQRICGSVTPQHVEGEAVPDLRIEQGARIDRDSLGRIRTYARHSAELDRRYTGVRRTAASRRATRIRSALQVLWLRSIGCKAFCIESIVQKP